ncbi:MAG: CCA tRNA nucleotidyltransferase [Chloroflexi bacterium]|nr:CCA tRNA nucleotidyltransferase [Chloroflexota bacterium]
MQKSLVREWLDSVPLRRRVVDYLCQMQSPIYLVGGTVRDALLGRPGYDIDVAVDGPALALARRVADHFHGAFVAMDPDRDVGRVVLRVGGEYHHVDFAGLRAEDILHDLRARDYTINAMAIPLCGGLGELLDPTGGYDDLRAGLLRATGDKAFEDDPARILRGIRLRGSLGFTVAGETEDLMREWLPALRFVSAERVRDEVAQILALDDAAESLYYAADLGALQTVFPQFNDDALTLAAIRAVRALEDVLRAAGGQAAGEIETAIVDNLRGATTLWTYLPRLTKHWAEELTVGRARRVAYKLAALLCVLPQAAEASTSITREFRLCAAEVRFVRLTIEGSARALAFCDVDSLEPLDIHRYYRAVGDAGLDGAVLALARQQAGGTACDDLARLADRAGRLLEAWFTEHARLVDPPPLLSGRDVLQQTTAKRGPLVGQVLDAVREAQVQGVVHSADEALAYARDYLERQGVR